MIKNQQDIAAQKEAAAQKKAAQEAAAKKAAQKNKKVEVVIDKENAIVAKVDINEGEMITI